MMRSKALIKQRLEVDDIISNIYNKKSAKSDECSLNDSEISDGLIIINKIFELTRNTIVKRSWKGALVQKKRRTFERKKRKTRIYISKAGCSNEPPADMGIITQAFEKVPTINSQKYSLETEEIPVRK